MKIILTLALALILILVACAIQIMSSAHTGLVLGMVTIGFVLIMICDEVVSNE